MATSWKDAYPQLAELDDAAIYQLMDSARVFTLVENSIAFHQGDTCSNYLLILDGSVKIITRTQSGREIVLYRLSSGDSCVLTTSCLFSHNRYPAEGVAEAAVTALAIPASAFQKAVKESSNFRSFVFQSFSSHLSSLIALVEEVAFGKLDTRLASQLLALSGDDTVLETTHQKLATEIGSAREVISRQLKDFESRGWIKLHRGNIEILEKQSLEKL